MVHYQEPVVAHGFTRSGVGYSKPKIVPEEADLVKAAEILNAGSKVAILVGAGARGTAPQLTEMATLLGAGVAKALLGKDVISDDHPFVTGAIGLLGTEPSWDLMQSCDTLLMVGRLPMVRIPAQRRRRTRRADRYRCLAFATVSR
jgi:pyruvate dehydrogenase (quinone)